MEEIIFRRPALEDQELIRSYFDQKGSHMQFNVVSRETLLDAQKHPENYQDLMLIPQGKRFV